MATSLEYIFGPQLYRTYRGNPSLDKVYEMNLCESKGEILIGLVAFICKVSYWTWPFFIPMIPSSNGEMFVNSLLQIWSFIWILISMVIIGFALRGIGRYSNSEYRLFISIYEAAKLGNNQAIHDLAVYDFEFSHWPTSFSANPHIKPPIHEFLSVLCESDDNICIRMLLTYRNIIYYMVSHTFGIRMVYPGQLDIVQRYFNEDMQLGRSVLIQEKLGIRTKITTENDIDIDTMYFDRRHPVYGPNGQFLVICCEGNAGYYETGCIETPLEAGYSVLGWNHPGFGGSTGVPYPSNIQCAIDAVMQFAIEHLRFPCNHVIIFAWSIGAYAASFAAHTYPEVNSVILDATFDNLPPLVEGFIPKIFQQIVQETLKSYINLNISEEICHYHGPVLLIRRSDDTMMSTEVSNVLGSNRLNHLLIQLLRYRYPTIFDEDTIPPIRDILSYNISDTPEILEQYEINESLCVRSLQSYSSHCPLKFPLVIPMNSIALKMKIALFLVKNHMIDFNADHHTALPPEYFQIPWSLEEVAESDTYNNSSIY